MKFTLPLAPTPQSRPRFAKTGHAYKSKCQQLRERDISIALTPFCPPVPLAGPISLRVRAYLPIPASWPRKYRTLAREGGLPHIQKPDLDNLMKQIKDALSRARFWEDDRQVCEYLPGTGKQWDDGKGARWEVEIMQTSAGQEE